MAFGVQWLAAKIHKVSALRTAGFANGFVSTFGDFE
jgi:hypothetical protein